MFLDVVAPPGVWIGNGRYILSSWIAAPFTGARIEYMVANFTVGVGTVAPYGAWIEIKSAYLTL